MQDGDTIIFLCKTRQWSDILPVSCKLCKSDKRVMPPNWHINGHPIFYNIVKIPEKEKEKKRGKKTQLRNLIEILWDPYFLKYHSPLLYIIYGNHTWEYAKQLKQYLYDFHLYLILNFTWLSVFYFFKQRDGDQKKNWEKWMLKIKLQMIWWDRVHV